MEFICGAFDPETEIVLIVEPWGHEIPLPPGEGCVLTVEGAEAESMTISWLPHAVMIWPPRYTVLTVLTRAGEELVKLDTKDIPELPIPPRFQA